MSVILKDCPVEPVSKEFSLKPILNPKRLISRPVLKLLSCLAALKVNSVEKSEQNLRCCHSITESDVLD